MPKIVVREATREDVEYVADHMRAADVVELRVAHGADPAMLVKEHYSDATYVRCALVDDVPTVLYGVFPTDIPETGSPWMLATDGIRAISEEFLAGCAAEVAEMRRHYPFLFNQVHRDNARSIRWLRRLGFMVDPKPTGPQGQFLNFWMGVSNA